MHLVVFFNVLCFSCSLSFGIIEFESKSIKGKNFIAKAKYSEVEKISSFSNVKIVQFDDYNHKQRTKRNANKPSNNEKTHFLIQVDNRTIEIDLSLNKALLSNRYSVTSFDANGNRVINVSKTESNCYYQGVVRGFDGSKVVGDTCHGMKAYIMLPGDILVAESFPNGTNLMYRVQDQQHNADFKFCGTTKSLNNNPDFVKLEKFLNERNKKKFLHLQQQQQKRTSFVELMIVADNAMYRKFNSTDSLEMHIKEIVNFVDEFYQEFDIRIILSHIEIWNVRDMINISKNHSTFLDRVKNYREHYFNTSTSSSPWIWADNIHVIYGGDFIGNTYGIAYVGTMCGKSSIGIAQYVEFSYFTASIITHEMGHNFGLLHIGPDCSCLLGTDCLMHVQSTYGRRTSWSNCSRINLYKTLASFKYTCLANIPNETHVYFGRACGNNIVEVGEECDCGEPKNCKSSCCNATTCLYKHGAECDDGKCCTDCKILKKGVTCRYSVEECDLFDYCTGLSSHCPDNIYVEDGTSCDGGNGACVEGKCLTHNAVCKQIWGEMATVASDLCYTYNTQGSYAANCGFHSNRKFIPCSLNDKKCGTLFCSNGNKNPIFGDRKFEIIISYRNVTHFCKSFGSFDIRTNTVIAFPSKNGMKCAPGMICKDFKCIPIPPTVCAPECNSKNGSCNNLGQCHCEQSSFPPRCDQYEIYASTWKFSIENTELSNASTVGTMKSTTEKWVFPNLQTVGQPPITSMPATTIKPHFSNRFTLSYSSDVSKTATKHYSSDVSKTATKHTFDFSHTVKTATATAEESNASFSMKESFTITTSHLTSKESIWFEIGIIKFPGYIGNVIVAAAIGLLFVVTLLVAAAMVYYKRRHNRKYSRITTTENELLWSD